MRRGGRVPDTTPGVKQPRPGRFGNLTLKLTREDAARCSDLRPGERVSHSSKRAEDACSSALVTVVAQKALAPRIFLAADTRSHCPPVVAKTPRRFDLQACNLAVPCC